MAYMSNEYSQCERILIILSQSRPDSAMKVNLQLVGALNYIMLNNFDSSYSYAKRYLVLVHDTSAASLHALDELYSRRNLPRLKNEKTLFWIGIVPGFGQMYVGKVGEGIANLALNIAFFSFGVYEALNGFYFTGYFVGTLSINKLYFGGRTRASNLLKSTNQNRLTEFQDRVKLQLTQSKP
jgi:TM2 domain-containing membrane protein YozV